MNNKSQLLVFKEIVQMNKIQTNDDLKMGKNVNTQVKPNKYK